MALFLLPYQELLHLDPSMVDVYVKLYSHFKRKQQEQAVCIFSNLVGQANLHDMV
ncbi:MULTISPECIES: hypothetical protein [unclassified Candidatus Cardinium]|uniref:hypothetical protein n=1 Tax=unclassified Candidatus Cardinium TaxID=2641185 RepID=UPI001FB2FE30|nr:MULTISPECIES: hypothetical protein [unclassified Candidatus Cardinium]